MGAKSNWAAVRCAAALPCRSALNIMGKRFLNSNVRLCGAPLRIAHVNAALLLQGCLGSDEQLHAVPEAKCT